MITTTGILKLNVSDDPLLVHFYEGTIINKGSNFVIRIHISNPATKLML
mgnify:CR=1 FL=1